MIDKKLARLHKEYRKHSMGPMLFPGVHMCTCGLLTEADEDNPKGFRAACYSIIRGDPGTLGPYKADLLDYHSWVSLMLDEQELWTPDRRITMGAMLQKINSL